MQRVWGTCKRPHNQKVAVPAGIQTPACLQNPHIFYHTHCSEMTGPYTSGSVDEEGGVHHRHFRVETTQSSRNHQSGGSVAQSKGSWEGNVHKFDCTHAEIETLVGLVRGPFQQIMQNMDARGAAGWENWSWRSGWNCPKETVWMEQERRAKSQGAWTPRERRHGARSLPSSGRARGQVTVQERVWNGLVTKQFLLIYSF